MKDEIKIIQDEDGHFVEYDDTYDLTIHCISQEEQDEVLMKLNNRTVCTDAIRRQAVAEVLLKYAHSTEGKAFAEFLISQINALPPVTTEKVGHWISNAEDDLKISEYTCSNCKGLSDEDSDYCPKCGSYNGGDAK